jgi:Ssp1 endopeptidase immunity protein Rap1a
MLSSQYALLLLEDETEPAAAEIADGGYLQGHRTCIPKGITEGRLQEVVRRYLDKHPEYKGYIGYQVVVVSLVEAFPCPTQ